MLKITDQNFEPKQSTKYWWTYVRKAELEVAGAKLPGLFQISNFEIDFPLFLLALFLEWWGLYNLLYTGSYSSWIYTAGLIMLDVLFAIGNHFFSMGRTCVLENEKEVAHLLARATVERNRHEWPGNKEKDEQVDAETKRNLQQKTYSIRLRRFVAWIFAILICALATIKIYLFYWLQGGVFTGITLGILVSYIVVAIIHITVTGYVFYALVAQMYFLWDKLWFANNKQEFRVTEYRRFPILTSVKLTPGKVDKHELTEIKEGEAYELQTWGILTDDQLMSFVNNELKSEAQWLVALHGLQHQLVILCSSPQRGKGPPA